MKRPCGGGARGRRQKGRLMGRAETSQLGWITLSGKGAGISGLRFQKKDGWGLGVK